MGEKCIFAALATAFLLILQGVPAAAEPEPPAGMVDKFRAVLGDDARAAYARLAERDRHMLALACATDLCRRHVSALQLPGAAFARKVGRCFRNAACTDALIRLGRSNQPSVYDAVEINGMPAKVWKGVRGCRGDMGCVSQVMATARRDKMAFFKAPLDEGMVLSAMLSARIGATDYVIVLANMVKEIGAVRTRDIVALSETH